MWPLLDTVTQDSQTTNLRSSSVILQRSSKYKMYKSLVGHEGGTKPRFTAIEASTLTITRAMDVQLQGKLFLAYSLYTIYPHASIDW